MSEQRDDLQRLDGVEGELDAGPDIAEEFWEGDDIAGLDPDDDDDEVLAATTDTEIHDTVLIAAAFSMFNRYVDGLATVPPVGAELYDPMGRRMASEGYVRK